MFFNLYRYTINIILNININKDYVYIFIETKNVWKKFTFDADKKKLIYKNLVIKPLKYDQQ